MISGVILSLGYLAIPKQLLDWASSGRDSYHSCVYLLSRYSYSHVVVTYLAVAWDGTRCCVTAESRWEEAAGTVMQVVTQAVPILRYCCTAESTFASCLTSALSFIMHLTISHQLPLGSLCNHITRHFSTSCSGGHASRSYGSPDIKSSVSFHASFVSHILVAIAGMGILSLLRPYGSIACMSQILDPDEKLPVAHAHLLSTPSRRAPPAEVAKARTRLGVNPPGGLMADDGLRSDCRAP